MTERFRSRFSKSQTPPTKIAHVHTRARHITMASFIGEAMVPGIHKLIRGHNFRVWSRSVKTSKIKHLKNRALYSSFSAVEI